MQAGVDQPKRDAGPDAARREAAREVALWQRLVLPVMVVVLLGAGLFFAWAIIKEVRNLYPRLEQAPATLEAQFDKFEAGRPEAATDPSYLRFKTLALLEVDALQRRYKQANAAMLARVWTRQMGFLTGMLMALVGSAFILGRIEIGQTTLSAEAQAPKAGLDAA